MVRVRETFIRICCVLLVGLLAGCAARGEGMGGAGSAQTEIVSGAGNNTGYSTPSEQFQNSGEKQLVIVFLALLEMDKNPELRITGKQAEQILPVVNTTIALGQLSLTSRKQLIDPLDASQMSYYEEISDKMKQRAVAMDRKPEPPPKPLLTEEEQKALARDLDERRKNEPLQEIDGVHRPPPYGNPPPSEFESGPNVEQQLVNLLTSRLSPTLSNLK